MTLRRLSSRGSHQLKLRPLALSLACMGLAPAMAQVLPIGLNSIAGSVSMTQGGGVMNINQGLSRAIAEWQSFSIGAGGLVNIVQPSTASVLLNRVVGTELSNIAGTLRANGHVYLINPNGVLFAPGSSVSVGGLVASTLSMRTSDDDFMRGETRIDLGRDAGVFASVINQGSIKATASGGTVALIGPRASNSGSIVADGGTAALASGDRVTIDFAGDGLTTFRVAPGVFGGVTNFGRMQADGGRVVLMATAGAEISGGVVNNGGVLQANSLASRNGEIILDSGTATSGVRIIGGSLSATGNAPGVKGGSIKLTGRAVGVGFDQGEGGVFFVPTRLDASGAAGGGSIELRGTAASGIATAGNVVVGGETTLRADATAGGNGGDIRLLGERSLRAHGLLSAMGGPNGGNGGTIETSGGFAAPADGLGGGLNIDGIDVITSAARGAAGHWTIDPFNVTIVPGAAAGTLPAIPFDPVVATTIQDGDIRDALNGGTSVTITTGAPGSGLPFEGDIVMNAGVRIAYTADQGPLTFQLDAHRSVRSAADVVISATGNSPLDVVFNANANGASSPDGGGQVSYSGSIFSNGGNVSMTGAWTESGGFDCSVCLNGPAIDTRAGNTIVAGVNLGGFDANPGGSVQLTGRTTSPVSAFATSQPGVYINGTAISSSSGNVTVFGSSTTDSGVGIFAPQGIGGIYTTSGAIAVTGVGSAASGSSIDIPGHGVLINAGTLESVSGDIAVRGLRLAGPGVSGSGVRLQDGALLTTLGSGDIEVTGQAQGDGPGVWITPLPPLGPTFTAIDGNHNVVLRASNDGSTDALVIGDTVLAANVLDLRPGGVDALGNAADRLADPITLGGAAATGFAISADELALFFAGSIVAGSNAHAGNIDVVGPLVMASPLTLQNGGGGNITLGAAVTSPQVGLVSAGNITQAPGADITAGLLLARSSGGNVLLNNPANNVGTVGGGAAGRFEYTDANALTLGPVSVTGFDAAGNLPQVVSASSMAADTVLVRTLSQDLSLSGNVASTGGANLVAAARFQNLGANTIAGAPWRVWADTWVGETRGGLAGSGRLPNLYNCAFLGLCTVTVPPADNHFLYAQQPTATVLVGSAARGFGLSNPLLTYSITGLILGDTGAGFSGGVSTPAAIGSLPGRYPIGGSFSSAEGYAVNVVPGSLLVFGAVDLPKVDVLRDMPTTWLYDRNIGQAPICFATGPLEGDLAQQGNDGLAREWSRVRSRPNLTSCVDTERRNGCADF